MSLVIRKLRAPVRLSLPGREPEDGFLSLHPALEPENRPETILELLNSSRRVIPFSNGADSGVALLTRLNIDWVVVGSAVEPNLVCPEHSGIAREQRVTLHFRDGRSVDGAARWALPDGNNRLSDFLNERDDFYLLATRIGTLLVNKACIRETRVSPA